MRGSRERQIFLASFAVETCEESGGGVCCRLRLAPHRHLVPDQQTEQDKPVPETLHWRPGVVGG